MESKNKVQFIIIAILIVVILVAGGILISNITKDEGESEKKDTSVNQGEEVTENEKEKVDIIDLDSNTRPYAVVINNTPVAVEVQEGLNEAYLVYEIPTEGYTSRILALYKDAPTDLVVGTVRSARHNFIDYALESDAIFCCFGWSHYAEDDLKGGITDYIQGLYGGPYYRNNPEGLATEHTAYTSIKKLNEHVNSNGIRSTSNDFVLLNYNGEDVDLSTAENGKAANTVTIHYGSSYQITDFKYDEETKMYTRYDNGDKCIDHNTKEAVTTKNIIVARMDYTICDDGYYWDLETVGEGEGYYITNGYAAPIKWSKDSRSSKTKYTYKTGTIIDGKDVGGQEITVSDGRTWIEIQTTKQELKIK